MLLATAKLNSTRTSHQSRSGTSCVLMDVATRSKMSLATQVSASGKRAATTRAMTPNRTTPRPDSQTIFRTGGTLRRAESRSCQLLRKLRRSEVTVVKPSSCRIVSAPAPADMPQQEELPELYNGTTSKTPSLMKSRDLRLVRNAAG